MKILQLVASSWGGAASHVRDLAIHLPRTAFSVSVAMPADGGNVTADDFLGAGIPHHTVGIGEGGSMIALRRIRRLVREGRFDVVHAHGARAAFWARLGLLRLSGSARPSFVYTIHGLMIPHYPLHRRLLLSLQERIQVRQTDRIIAVSRAERDHLRTLRLGDGRKIEVIRLGIDVDAYTEPRVTPNALRRQLGIREDGVLLTMICRFFRPRDFPTLLNALRTAAGDVAGLRLLLVGEGPWRATVETLVDELDLRDRIVLPGQRSDVVDILHASDVFVLTSAGGDGLPISILEAMAAARPVIASDTDGIPEEVVHGDTGLLAPVHDTNALARAMVALARDPARRKAMGLAGRERVQRHFTCGRMIEDLARLYRSL